MALPALPTELVLHIASYCTDKELCCLSATCKGLHGLVFSRDNGIWRKRFLQTFDNEQQHRNYMKQYIQRFNPQRHPLFLQAIRLDLTVTETPILEMTAIDAPVLEQVVKEAFFSGIGRTSKNMRYLSEMLEAGLILGQTLDRQWPFHAHGNYEAIQLLFFHQSVDTFAKHEFNDFETAQQAAYGDPDEWPLFDNTNRPIPQVSTLLNIAMFFKAHYCVFKEVQPNFDVLAPIDRPQPWTTRLNVPTPRPLGTNWRGSSVSPMSRSCLNMVRNCQNGVLPIQDNFDAAESDENGGDGFDDIVLSFEPEHQAQHWPRHVLRSLDLLQRPPGAGGRDNAARIPFVGNAAMLNPYLLAGFVEPAEDVSGIPGWQRITFVAYPNPAPEDTTNFDLFGMLARKGTVPLGKEPSAEEKEVELQRYSVNPYSRFVREWDNYHFPECEAEFFSAVDDKYPEELWEEIGYPPVTLEQAVARRNFLARKEYRYIVEHAINPGPVERQWWANTSYRTPNIAADLTPLIRIRHAFAYEGLVWPGGNVMMGRWWNLAEDVWDDAKGDWSTRGKSRRRDSGPWCFWCTDRGYEWKGEADGEADSEGGGDVEMQG